MQYSTPGVYVVEQNAFPNSVVEVATAIPAFIGYTAKSFYKGKELGGIPTRIESMQDFVAFFGEAPVQQFALTVLPDGAGASSPATTSPLPVAASTLTFTVSGKPKKYLLAPAQAALYYLYNAVHLFYLNGGSTCYIVSIGGYDDTPSDKDDFENAIAALKYEQDPTMLLCPDARRLGEADYYEVMQQMLKHCADMQSRVAIFDLYDGAITDPHLVEGDESPVAKFRSNIGQNNLSYGIAYFPWVQTSIVSLTDVSFQNLTPDSLSLLLADFNPNSLTPQETADQIAKKIGDAKTNGDLTGLATTLKTLTDDAAAKRTKANTSFLTAAKDTADADAIKQAQAAASAARSAATAADAIKTTATAALAANAAPADKDPYDKAVADAKQPIAQAQATASSAQSAAKTADDANTALAADNQANGVTSTVDDAAKTAAQTAADKAKAAADSTGEAAAATTSQEAGTKADAADTAAKDAETAVQPLPTAAATMTKVQTSATTATLDKQAADDADKAATNAEQDLAKAVTKALDTSQQASQAARGSAALSASKVVPILTSGKGPDSAKTENIFTQAITLQSDTSNILDAAGLQAKRKDINNKLLALFPAYTQTMTTVARYLSTMPVAPAMAGVYTATDNGRGVWKAPANVSLNAVIAPTVALSDTTQGTLNVDALSGKSINAIRAFKGLGVTVWGGRTLDGNSQDWRYVNVRRTMIMIEQSVKLAARAYVFDPNTPNTWTTLRSMINSFLFNLWKQGALLGTSPAEAYVVNVGLGSTMTTDDVIAGLLKVTVLVALVRPAEFIVLTFEQQMPGAGA